MPASAHAGELLLPGGRLLREAANGGGDLRLAGLLLLFPSFLFSLKLWSRGESESRGDKSFTEGISSSFNASELSIFDSTSIRVVVDFIRPWFDRIDMTATNCLYTR